MGLGLAEIERDKGHHRVPAALAFRSGVRNEVTHSSRFFRNILHAVALSIMAIVRLTKHLVMAKI